MSLLNWPIECAHPSRLLWGFVAIALCLAIGRYSLVDRTVRWRRTSVALRVVGLSLLSLAFARWSWRMESHQTWTVVGIDRSASVGADAVPFAQQQLDQLAQNAQGREWSWFEFAGSTSPLHSGSSDEKPHLSAEVSASWQPLASNLEGAVEHALASIPAGYRGHIVLLSDGRETQADVMRAARTTDIPISVIAYPANHQPEVQLARIVTPALARVGQPFECEIYIHATEAGHGRLKLFRDDVRLDVGSTEQIAWQPGENRFVVRQQLETPGLARITARVNAAIDTRGDDNEATAVVTLIGAPRIALIDPEPETCASLQSALQTQQIDVELLTPAEAPMGLVHWLAYDAVLLSNVSADQLTPTQLEELAQFVQDFGGGLLMLGGERAFGLGGYAHSPLAPVLPVRCDVEKDEETPTMALMLLIDRSGSMGGQKLELAKEAARSAVETLGPRDQVGILAFDDEPYWISPLASTADKRPILERIGRLVPAGGTSLYPALQQTLTTLRDTPAQIKHVIILSDGITSPADTTSLIQNMVDERITVSAVVMGDKTDRRLMQEIANLGGGRFYECRDPRSVPQVFVQEATRANPTTLREEPFVPQLVRATSVLRSIDWQTVPPLFGFVATRPQPTSQLILATETGEPLLAWWRYGLGMSAAFTSDAKSRWAADWLVWPDYGTFWAQTVRHLLRPPLQQQISWETTQDAEGIHLRVDLSERDGALINQADVRLDLFPPTPEHGEPIRQMTVAQIAPGRYHATLPLRTPGAYPMVLHAKQGDQTIGPLSFGVPLGYAEELRWRPVDLVRLQAIAQSTKGLVQPTARQVFEHRGPPVYRSIPLEKPALFAALILLLLDVGVRRW